MFTQTWWWWSDPNWIPGNQLASQLLVVNILTPDQNFIIFFLNLISLHSTPRCQLKTRSGLTRDLPAPTQLGGVKTIHGEINMSGLDLLLSYAPILVSGISYFQCLSSPELMISSIFHELAIFRSDKFWVEAPDVAISWTPISDHILTFRISVSSINLSFSRNCSHIFRAR